MPGRAVSIVPGMTHHENASAGRIGGFIRRERLDAGLEPAELGARAGISAGRVCAIEADGPNSCELFAIAQALGVSVDALLRPRTGFIEPEVLADPHVRYGIGLIEEMQAAERLVLRYGL